jgi:SAM-dependent methyltransferase
MDFARPTRLDLLAESLSYRLAAPLYRRYARTLPLTGGEVVLDFGCGGGGLSRFLASRLERGGMLVCYDPYPVWTGVVRKRLARADHVHCAAGGFGDIRRIAGSFDLIVVHFVLHDVRVHERGETVLSLSRLLRRGGSLCIREPLRPSHGIDPAEVRRLMTEAGLKEIRTEYSRALLRRRTFSAVFRAENP